MPAAIPVILGVTAAVSAGSAIYSGVEGNQERQHAKGAAQAQETEAGNAIDAQKKQDQATQAAKGQDASATQAAAIQALRASLSASSGFGGSLLTSGQGASVAPTSTKSLLGV